MDRKEQIEETNKEQQIEEIENIILYTLKKTFNATFKDVAKALYNAGYRKLPKDSVVLSREEYEMLANNYKNLEIKYSNLCDNYRLCKDANKTLKQNVIVTRKKTAENIFKMLISELGSNQFLSGKRIIMEVDVENLAKQFDVEIKE